MTLDPAKPKTPKARLIELLTMPTAQEKLLEATRLMDTGPHGLTRTALMMAGLRVPEDNESHAHFVSSLLHAGFYVVPAFLGVPEIGDLYVALDARMEPMELGFVAKFNLADLSEHGRLKQRPEWFLALGARISDEGRPLLRRQLMSAEHPVGFWLRLAGG